MGQICVCNFVFQIKSVPVPLGEIDLEMLSELHKKHPGVTVDNEVVEPSRQQLYNYKGTVFTGTHFSHTTQNESLYTQLSKIGFSIYLQAKKDIIIFLLVKQHLKNSLVHILAGNSPLTTSGTVEFSLNVCKNGPD